MAKRFEGSDTVDRRTAVRRTRSQLFGDGSGTVYLSVECGSQPGNYQGKVPDGFTMTGRKPLPKESGATAQN
ncbi:hypothetical protein CL614_01055 [archaeon]|nr:hypothetical protein [archaeon]|tara:strand:+ start:53 stop:268 length:216 start_codon:yes stop_codon:yes gene_type:complete